MKEKRTYSLTAKERKQKRAQAENRNKPENTEADAEAQMLTQQTQVKRSAAFVGGLSAAAAVILLVAILTPIIAFVVNPYRGYDDVIARFNLSNGMTLEYVIDEEHYNAAATNFIFLAKNKFFDNTVFFDAQNGWLRFGGYEEQPSLSSWSSTDYTRTHHKARNKEYVEAFDALPNDRFKDTMNKFGYRLRADTDGTNKEMLNRAGMLAFLYSDTSTEFQFSYREQPINDIRSVDGTNTTLSPTLVGYPFGDDTKETIDKLAEIASDAQDNTSITSGYLWKPPTKNGNIYIDSVRVYNLNKSKWKNFDFIEYINREDDKTGNTLLNYWTGLV